MITDTISSTLASSDSRSPGDWVESHADYLFHFALGQVCDVGIAEDLVQEAFLAAIKSRDEFDGKSSERTWLVGILCHKICDHLRHICYERAHRARPTPTGRDQDDMDSSVLWLHEVAAECISPCRRMELQEFRGNLEIALGKLPARLAQTFQLYEIEECPNQEVCQKLNVTASNLWVMLQRARKRLRNRLSGWWQGGVRGSRSPAPIG